MRLPASLRAATRVLPTLAPFIVAIALVQLVAAHRPPTGILLNGAVIGSLYSLIAMGLVLVYRANRIINFAQAGLGAVPAVAALLLLADRGLPYVLSWTLVLAGAGVLGGLTETTAIRRFRRAPRLILTVATIGVAQVLAFLEFFTPGWVSGTALPPTRFHTPFTHWRTQIGGVYFTGDQALTVAVVVAAALALATFLKRSRYGIAVRAVADDADRTALLGVPVRRVETVVWVVAAMLSGIGVFLRAPLVGLPLGTLTGPAVLLFALTAAVVAGMESLPIALCAGVLLGVLDQSAFYASRTSDLSYALLLPIVLTSLLLSPQVTSRVASLAASTWEGVHEVRPLPAAMRSIPAARGLRLGGYAAGATVVVAAPFVVGPAHRGVLCLAVVYAIIGMSLVILTGWTGQISLGQFAFAGVGAAVAGGIATHAAGGAGDFFLTLAAAGTVGALLAVAVGIPALRLQGLLLAVTTLAFAATAQSFLLNRRFFGWLLPDDTTPVLRPVLFGHWSTDSDFRYYFLCLVALGLAIAAAYGVRRSRSGRVLIATRDNPRAAAVYGVSVARTRVAAFALSGFVAALAGGLLVYLQGSIDAGAFKPTDSILLFAMAVIGGLGSITGAMLGAAYVVTFTYLVPDYAFLATGAGMLALLLVFPGGLAQVVARLRDVLVRRLMPEPAETAPVAPVATPVSPARTLPPDVGEPLLQLRGVTASYGSVQVLFGIDFDVYEGETLALLGTNGAGKSTVLKVVSGLLDADTGEVRLAGEPLRRREPRVMIDRGVVQMPGGRGVLPTLTVRENMRLAQWTRGGGHVDDGLAHLRARFPELEGRVDVAAGELSGGEQQMLALGMALVLRPRLLMVDELSLGLAPVVVERLLETVRELADAGTTVVLVEQSVNVAMSVADRAYFLEKGEVRFAGRTRDLLERGDVARAVFLAGTTTTAESRVPPPRRSDEVALRVDGLTRRFGGVIAVNDVSFSVAAGEMVALIGHNGAGKTTIFDLICGFLPATAGDVQLCGRSIGSLAAYQRSWLGLGRSFQDARIFPSLTVAENIAVSFERHLAHRDHLAAALHLPDVVALEDDIAYSVEDLVELLNLQRYRDALASELSTGTRRIVELAMSLAHDPRVLLLDEPSAGIAQREVEALAALLRQVHDDTQCAILVIDHDMPLLQQTCSRMLAFETGRLIADAAPDDVLRSPRVIASYLGTSPDAVERSGTRRRSTSRTKPALG